MNPFLDTAIEVSVRCAFQIHRAVLSTWARCAGEEQDQLVAKLSPRELQMRAVEEAFEMRRRATLRTAALGVVQRMEQQNGKSHKENRHE